jgi:hypothetical protein
LNTAPLSLIVFCLCNEWLSKEQDSRLTHLRARKIVAYAKDFEG